MRQEGKLTEDLIQENIDFIVKQFDGLVTKDYEGKIVRTDYKYKRKGPPIDIISKWIKKWIWCLYS